MLCGRVFVLCRFCDPRWQATVISLMDKRAKEIKKEDPIHEGFGVLGGGVWTLFS